MTSDMIISFITPDLLVLVVMLYCVGLFLKNIPSIPNYIIPLSLLGFGVVSCVLYSGFVLNMGFGASAVITSVVQGILASSVSVYADQLLKQMIDKKHGDKK